MSAFTAGSEVSTWERIDLEDRDEVHDWAASFSVTDDELIEAVRTVGVQASRVREYFEKTLPRC